MVGGLGVGAGSYAAAMTDSATRQRVQFSQGFALGLLLNGRTSIEDDGALDFALARAFRGWPDASHFPALRPLVEFGGRHMVAGAVIGHASGRRHFHVYGWEDLGGVLQVVPRSADDLSVADDPQDASEVAGIIHEDVTAESWRQLVADVLAGQQGS